MEPQILKQGECLMFRNTFWSGPWRNRWAVLTSDSKICFYKKQDDASPAISLFINKLVPYICVGKMTDKLSKRRPKLPNGYSINQLLAIGTDRRANKVHWILFPSSTLLDNWFLEMVKTFPSPSQEKLSEGKSKRENTGYGSNNDTGTSNSDFLSAHVMLYGIGSDISCDNHYSVGHSISGHGGYNDGGSHFSGNDYSGHYYSSGHCGGYGDGGGGGHGGGGGDCGGGGVGDCGGGGGGF